MIVLHIWLWEHELQWTTTVRLHQLEQSTFLSSEPYFRISKDRALPSLNVSPLLITYTLRLYLLKLRGSIRRNISAVCPPDPRTITSFAEDFRDGCGCTRNDGNIHNSRTNEMATSPSVIKRNRVITELIAILRAQRLMTSYKRMYFKALSTQLRHKWWYQRQSILDGQVLVSLMST